ncbi:tRNA adenosine deaminase-associated protein [Corynebacterium glyciniphilum]|uniref:tRNA adenosine deaminase-associated protein n=1 Tax=Corynebacterium glyciniphilum TaxID=1404244 RepID=UPI0026513B23|nr:tRNA adenosine deaminase-associated protein [Corynebacterium glyciniphilum]MDN5683934.1 tRNA adenosine deaminase-associated protein [Corynebacterium glyciniphilum]MDN6705396.1 tRNA adenosine deaminase-associated protein [Corynebacterium glyciniphilum]
MSGFVVAAELAEGDSGGASWRLRVLDRKIPGGLRPLLTELGRLRAAGVLLGMVCVEDDWCALVRPGPRGAQLLLSDASVIVEDDDEPGIDLARDILAELDVDGPTDDDIDDADDPDAPWPDGDFDILADLGVSEQVLSVILDDGDMLATEQLMRVAEELGFDDDLAEILDKLGYTGWS